MRDVVHGSMKIRCIMSGVCELHTAYGFRWIRLYDYTLHATVGSAICGALVTLASSFSTCFAACHVCRNLRKRLVNKQGRAGFF